MVHLVDLREEKDTRGDQIEGPKGRVEEDNGKRRWNRKGLGKEKNRP